MFAIAVLMVIMTGCTQYHYLPIIDGGGYPWEDDDEEVVVFEPNVNDSTELSAALASITAGKPVELRLAAGTYNAEQIVLPKGADVTIIGDSNGETIISLPKGETDLEEIAASSDDTSDVPYTGVIVSKNGSITLKNLTVAANP